MGQQGQRAPGEGGQHIRRKLGQGRVADGEEGQAGQIPGRPVQGGDILPRGSGAAQGQHGVAGGGVLLPDGENAVLAFALKVEVNSVGGSVTGDIPGEGKGAVGGNQQGDVIRGEPHVQDALALQGDGQAGVSIEVRAGVQHGQKAGQHIALRGGGQGQGQGGPALPHRAGEQRGAAGGPGLIRAGDGDRDALLLQEAVRPRLQAREGVGDGRVIAAFQPHRHRPVGEGPVGPGSVGDLFRQLQHVLPRDGAGAFLPVHDGMPHGGEGGEGVLVHKGREQQTHPLQRHIQVEVGLHAEFQQAGQGEEQLLLAQQAALQRPGALAPVQAEGGAGFLRLIQHQLRVQVDAVLVVLKAALQADDADQLRQRLHQLAIRLGIGVGVHLRLQREADGMGPFGAGQAGKKQTQAQQQRRYSLEQVGHA